MQKHSIALGYFFLTVFCIHVSHWSAPIFCTTGYESMGWVIG